MSKGRVLITGVNGYIGSRLARYFLHEGYTVAGIDRAQGCSNQRVDYFSMDITDHAKMESWFLQHDIQHVIHLAALVHKKNTDLSMAQYHQINTLASANLFQCARTANVETILFASTVEVYGDQDARIIDECTPCKPKSYYAISKYEAERALLQLEGDSCRYAIMRFAPVYASDFRLNLDKRFYLRRGKIAYYFKDGKYSFNFCAASNVINFIKAFIESEAPSGIYNISDSQNISAEEFIRLEKQYADLKYALRMPYILCYVAIAGLEAVTRCLSKSEPYFSRYNLKKLFKSTVYNSERAQEVVGGYSMDMESILYLSDGEAL